MSDDQGTPTSQFTLRGEKTNVISSVGYEILGEHAHLTVWHRGGYAGALVIRASDLAAVLRRLMSAAYRSAISDDA